jgi:hypothetical protein
MFKYHVTTKVAAARHTFNALCRLVQHETGLSPSTMRLIYQAYVTSRSDFGAEIWWQGQKNLAMTLQLQQNAALHRILNAFCSTPIIALHNKATLPPVAVRLTHKLCKYTLCTPHGNSDPTPAFSTMSTETIDFSIGFGFAALIYIPL